MQQPAPWLAAGRYEVGEVVGRGGYGMVCRGVDRKTGQAVALKMLSPEAGRDADVVERMLREQQALVALAGTCAVTAVDLCRLDSGAPCLVMEWLDGVDLEQLLVKRERAQQRGGTEQLLALLGPLTDTLGRAHEIGIVHRDIKPANIFVTPNTPPGVRLLDFGLSRMKSAAPLTALGMVMGSPSYIAPETWRGDSASLDGRADLFALAVVVYRWLTGAVPFDASDLVGKMTAVTSGPRPSVTPLRSDLPSLIDVWMSRALAVNPDDRFQSAAHFYQALGSALRGEEWDGASAEHSGVQRSVNAARGEPKGLFASAWARAAALLTRFTTPKAREERPSAPTEPAILPSTTPASDRQANASQAIATPAGGPTVSTTVLRDTTLLDDTDVAPATAPVRAAPPPPPRRAPKAKPAAPIESVAKAQRARAQAKQPKAKKPPKTAAPAPAKTSKAAPKTKAAQRASRVTVSRRAVSNPERKANARGGKLATKHKPK